jgi:hypothetical protein
MAKTSGRRPARPANRPDFFGEQLVVDEEGEFIRTEPRLLLTSTAFSIDEIYEHVNALGGLVIPAHVERTSNGLFPTLGLVSASWPVEAFEISRHTTPEKARAKFPASELTRSSKAATCTCWSLLSARPASQSRHAPWLKSAWPCAGRTDAK